MATATYASPLGSLCIEASDTGIRRLSFDDAATSQRASASATAKEIIAALVAELDEYFAGRLQNFSAPLDPIGTEFQLAVWRELSRIPYGATVSYADIAAAIGKPNAQRAVGQANNRNPIAIVVPCHRVVGANGKLVGYGGELWRKSWLLDHEASRHFSLTPS